jgi:hypothetical protein
MIGFPMPQSSIRISLKYSGISVDDGSMPVDDVIEALKGFSGAYGKTASFLLPESSHELRISAVNLGSVDLSIVAWVTSAQGADTLKALSAVSNAARYVFGTVVDFIKAKKFTRGGAAKYSIEGSNNTMIVINNEGGKQAISKEVIELMKSKLIDGDVSKIVSPLSEGFLDSAKLTASDGNEETGTTIESTEKGYFGESKTETSNPVQINGRIISDSKVTNRGTFQRGDGKHIRYHYVGNNAENFRNVYAFKGSVRVRGMGYLMKILNLRTLT